MASSFLVRRTSRLKEFGKVCNTRTNYIQHYRRISNKSNAVSFFGACFDLGQPHRGVSEAPQLIRQAGLRTKLEERGYLVQDMGDINWKGGVGGGAGDPRAVLAFNSLVHDKVRDIRTQGNFCLTLGGDHSIGLGSVAGHLSADPEAVVLWVDAHADINTMEGSPSGNMHGMPVSLNIRELQGENQMAEKESKWLQPNLLPSRLAFIGLRDVDLGEWEIINRFNIAAFPMQAIDRTGIVNAVETALNMVDPLKKRNIHLSFDIDVLDPREAPATGTRVRGGLTLREALTLCEIVAETGRLRALDLVEVNPQLASSQDEVKTTVDAAIEVILAALGKYSQ